MQLDYKKYNIDYGNYQSADQTWQQQRNDYKASISGTARGYCVNANGGNNNQDCVDNYGTGWIQTGWGGSCNEIQFQYRECTRSTSTENSMLNDWIRNHQEPIQPQFIPISLGTITGNNINCCSQLFSNLSAGNALEISNINQQCQQKIISQIADVVQTNQTTLNNKTNTDVPTESEFDLFVSQNSTMLIIGILFLLLSCSCSGAFIVMS